MDGWLDRPEGREVMLPASALLEERQDDGMGDQARRQGDAEVD